MPGDMRMLSLILAVVSLGLASYEDIRTRSVSNYIWWIYCSGLLLLPFRKEGLCANDILYCILALFIQEHIMSRAYGRADSHAFSCCAFFLILTGFGPEGHILHISLSLALLIFVQTLHGNIGKDMKLKEPVPFIPYIAVTFFFTIMIGFICKMPPY